MPIIFRYLASEILKAMAVVALVVLTIAIGWRFSGYLTDAAEGQVMQEVLFWILLYRVPGMIELILPISFFIGIVITCNRLAADSEMLVLRACGVSNLNLLVMTLILAAGITLVAGLVSLWLKPEGEARLFQMLSDQRNITEFDTLIPGRFQTTRSRRRVTYTEELNRSAGRLEGVFLAERKVGKEYVLPPEQDLVIAASGQQRVDPRSGNRFLVLRDGYRYSGKPGTADYQIIHYREYGQLIGRGDYRPLPERAVAVPTLSLFSDASLMNAVELQWRLSMVLMLPVVALLAFLFAQVSPRKSSYMGLLPGVGICILYVILLSSMRTALEQSQLALFPGLYAVHALMLALLACLYGGLWLLQGRRYLSLPGFRPGGSNADS